MMTQHVFLKHLVSSISMLRMCAVVWAGAAVCSDPTVRHMNSHTVHSAVSNKAQVNYVCVSSL